MDDPLIWIELCLIALCLGAIAFFSLSEAALVATNRIRLRVLVSETALRSDEAEALETISTESRRFLAMAIVAIDVPVLVASALVTHVVHRLRPDSVEWVSLAMIGFILVFCELAPKTYAVHNAERLTVRLAKPARMMMAPMGPLVALVMALSELTLRLVGVRPAAAPEGVTEESIRHMAEVGKEEGVLESEELKLIHSIFEFRETIAREVMMPRTDMVSLPDDSSLDEALDTFEKSGYSRIPVYRERLDNIVGILYVKDLMIRLEEGDTDFRPFDLIRETLFVPETKRLDDLFREMRRQKVHIAVVFDEHGGTSGVVTNEDLLEEIVGEIHDETDLVRPLVVPISEDEYIVNGRLNLDDLTDAVGVKLPEGEYDTVGGFVVDWVGRVPDLGERFETAGAEIVVEKVEGLRVSKVRIRRLRVEREEAYEGAA